MSRDDRKHDLRRTLVARGFERDRSVTSELRYVGKVKAGGRDVLIALIFPDLEFTRLPRATLVHPETEAAHVIAHLSLSGDLCFARNEDVVLDRYDVGGTALLCLKLAQQGIERALTHVRLEDEIANEFSQHWQGCHVYYDVRPARHVAAKIYLVGRATTQPVLLLADNEAALKRLVAVPSERQSIIARSKRAFCANLPTKLTFKRNFRPPKTLEEFFAWIESIEPGIRNALLAELVHSYPGTAPVFINAPNGCVGISVEPKAPILRAAQRRQGLIRLLDRHAAAIPVDRYSGIRVDVQHIFSRNMNSQKPLVDKRLALIGCGTIGSHLAKLLVQSGAGYGSGSLMLLDNQVLQPGNVGRHFLGVSAIGENKATALKDELLRFFPDANIMSVVGDAIQHLGNWDIYDLVIDATGEEALSISINHHFVHLRKGGKAPDVLNIRLFGNGAAAQGILVDDSGYACFKCLKPDLNGNWRFNPLKPGIQIAPRAAACGEDPYVPYGPVPSVMAAALALQMVVDWNSGTTRHRLRTVRVDQTATIEVSDKNPTRSEKCPTCADSHNT